MAQPWLSAVLCLCPNKPAQPRLTMPWRHLSLELRVVHMHKRTHRQIHFILLQKLWKCVRLRCSGVPWQKQSGRQIYPGLTSTHTHTHTDTNTHTGSSVLCRSRTTWTCSCIENYHFKAVSHCRITWSVNPDTIRLLMYNQMSDWLQSKSQPMQPVHLL